jgi:hypothetical protein
MSDSCGCPSEAGAAVCDLSASKALSTERHASTCPQCGQTGKVVQGQTVKALLTISLRAVREVEYRFCLTPTCPAVYFASDGQQTFTVDQVHGPIYQKASHDDVTPLCYCFGYTVGAVRAMTPARRAAVIDDINAGIQAGQCACDVRNPQGSCCLGNVRELIKQLDAAKHTADQASLAATAPVTVDRGAFPA